MVEAGSLTAMLEPTARKRTQRVVVFTTDPVGPEMPGPAIRAWELARALGEHLEVVLASTVAVSGDHPNAELRLAATATRSGSSSRARMSRLRRAAWSTWRDELQETENPVAVDIYDPYHLENLETGGAARPEQDWPEQDWPEQDWAEQDRAVTRLAGVVNAGLRRGDFFTCASERQRDFWLGSLAAVGRVNPYNYQVDPLLGRLVSVVPFGLPERAASSARPGLARFPPGHWSRRQGRALGWGSVQLARPAFRGEGGRPPAPAPPGATCCFPRHAPPQPRCAGDACRHQAPGAIGGAWAHGEVRVLQRRLGRMRSEPTSSWTRTWP